MPWHPLQFVAVEAHHAADIVTRRARDYGQLAAGLGRLAGVDAGNIAATRSDDRVIGVLAVEEGIADVGAQIVRELHRQVDLGAAHFRARDILHLGTGRAARDFLDGDLLVLEVLVEERTVQANPAIRQRRLVADFPDVQTFRIELDLVINTVEVGIETECARGQQAEAAGLDAA